PTWLVTATLEFSAMKAIRNCFSDAEITLLVRPWVAGLFTSATFIDKVWSEPKPSRLADWTRTTRAIRSSGFDLALLLPNSFESALMMFLSRVPNRVGYATDGRGWMLTNSIAPAGDGRHQVDYYLDLVKTFSSNTTRPSIEIEATVNERASARRLLESQGIRSGTAFLALNPGAAYGSA